jgi:hypothetical protein
LKILLKKPFRPRPSADGFANWFVNGFAIGGLDRFPLPPRRTNWKPVEKSIGKPESGNKGERKGPLSNPGPPPSAGPIRIDFGTFWTGFAGRAAVVMR